MRVHPRLAAVIGLAAIGSLSVAPALAAAPVAQSGANAAHVSVAGNGQEFLRPGNRLVLRRRLNDGHAADDLLRFGERAVGHGHFAIVSTNAKPDAAGQAASTRRTASREIDGA